MTNRDDFDDPISGDYVQVAEMVGHLVLFYPLEHKQSVNTMFGEKDAVIADVHDLTDGVKYESAMFLQGALIGVLKRNAGTGRPVLGVVGKGEAKKGQQAPYLLTPGNDEQKAIARKYIAANAPVKDEFAV